MSPMHGEPRALALLELSDDDLVRQCSVDHYRASGPGGQKRNKTSSAVRLRHTPTGLVAIGEEDRSQHVNKARAIRRLRETIALHVRGEIDAALYQPSERLRSYINGSGQLRISERNRDYAIVVCEVLDVMTALAYRVSETAERIGITTAQLVEFIERDPKLWDRVNQLRKAAGMKALR